MFKKFQSLCIPMLLILSACGVSIFTEPKTNQVIEDRVGSPFHGSGELIGTLATTAERRIVLTPLQGDNIGMFCAEPSPDAAESLVASFTASVDASATGADSATKSIKAELARSIATSIGAMTRRSQGLQFFRDGIFALCQFRMNGFITEGEFSTQYFKLREAAERLMVKEIESENWNKLPTIVINSPNAPEEKPKEKS